MSLIDKKQTLSIDGTCWLVAYINYISSVTDIHLSFYKCLCINRILRYKSLIELIEDGTELEKHPELFEVLTSFEGSVFDIIDLLNYELEGFNERKYSDEDIYLSNELIKFKLAYLIDHKDSKEEILKEINTILDNLYGTHTINYRQRKHNTIQIISFDTALLNKTNYKFKTNNLFSNDISFYNYNDSNALIDIIEKRLANNQVTLISFDLNKSFLGKRKLIYMSEISNNIFNKYFGVSNHYLIITSQRKLSGVTFYKVQDVYENQSYDYIQKEYIKHFINCIIVEDMIEGKCISLNAIDYLEGVYDGNI